MSQKISTKVKWPGSNRPRDFGNLELLRKMFIPGEVAR